MTQPTQPTHHILPSIDDPISIRRRNWRMFKDGLATFSMTLGGISVIIAVLLIFFYLFYVVYPLMVPAKVEARERIGLIQPEAGPSLFLDTEEKSELAARLSESGKLVFFNTRDGKVTQEHALPLPAGSRITSLAQGTPGSGLFALGLSDGQSLVFKRKYKISYPNNVRTVTPALDYPLGEQPVRVDEQGKALTQLAVRSGDEATSVVAVTEDHRLLVVSFKKETSFLDDSETLTRSGGSLNLPATQYTGLRLAYDQRNLYLADAEGRIHQYDLADKKKPALLQTVQAVAEGQTISAMEMLNGGISLIVGASDGSLSQWFPVRDAQNRGMLTKIREFHDQTAAITRIEPEQRRKGFIATDAAGQIGLYYTTSARTLLVQDAGGGAIRQAVLTPSADSLLLEDATGVQRWEIHNDHPEISWSALWGKVWYESYDEPKYVWQSTSGSSEFESKFSLVPLTFGTLKAAFYALLISVPLAVLGAIYTAYFMAPRMRGYVKPGVEIMAALPTVILGFLAGLWLAPVVEENLPGVFAMLLVVPIGILLFTYLWYRLPNKLTRWCADEWAAALLIPVVVGLVWFSFAVSYPLEHWLFAGSMREWMNQTLGIGYDQRNALIVGLTMGVAVIPTIFSITEDAIFSVPKHLTTGSLALGATPWQTMTRVVLLTASPGIFSAVMIGMGRAVGETMIVLMATGNTPVIDLSMFQGMRTLAANIAVEMPESELNSTHYRLLFLSGLVLFMLTFLINTLAEMVRQHLRGRYANL